MPLVVRPSVADDQQFAFSVKRAALREYVARVWGWDDDLQEAFHASDWAANRPDVIELDGVPVGTIEAVEHADHLYVGEFYLLPEYQRRGLGSEILGRILAMADRLGLPTRLQFLKVNPVRSLYERTGFRVTRESTTHFFAERPANSGTRAPDA